MPAPTRPRLRKRNFTMPIKPENKPLYPANWKEIRAQILTRAHNHCEFCGVANGLSVYNGERWYTIVLTIAHLDHDPTNNDPANLRALCQACHLKYDAQHHAETRAQTMAKQDQSLQLEFTFDETYNNGYSY